MRFKKYNFVKTEENHQYEFKSQGPQGTVRKFVLYHNIKFLPIPIFNLALGDWNSVTGKLDDSVITNNSDRKKVLATVAATILDFLRTRPDVVLYAEGNTPARNRLYRMGIRLIYDEIKDEMDLYGRYRMRWYEFAEDMNFDAFTLANKNLNFNPNEQINFL